MKMFKAVKKLKFWSKKKKNRKSLPPQPSPSFPPLHCHCSYSSSSLYYQCSYASSSVQPSAPPLPPWLQAELPQDEFPMQEQAEPLPEFSYTTDQIQDIESCPMFPESTPSYQQYMVPNPDYGLPIVQQTERSAGYFGCVIDDSVNLIRCVCPCFRIKEFHREL